MRIVLAGPASPPALLDLLADLPSGPVPAGLGGTPVNALARALVDAGHRVTVVTLSPGQSQEWRAAGDGLEVICGPFRTRARERARDFFAAERRWLAAAIARVPADVVHAHWTYEYALAARASAAPTVITVHDAPLTVLRHHRDAYRVVRALMAARVRVARPELIAVSPYVAERWQREMLDGRRPLVVPSAVAPVAGAATPSGTRVVVIGTGDPLKNVDAAVRAFALVKAARPDAQLRLIGPGLAPEDSLARSHQRDAPGVAFLGRLPAADVQGELRAASVLVHPSLEESHGLALVEAMQLGVPVVGGVASGAVPWTLDGGAAGLLVDVRDPRAIAAAVLRLHADESLRATIRRRAYSLVADRHAPAAVADAHAAVYAGLGVSRRPGKAR